MNPVLAHWSVSVVALACYAAVAAAHLLALRNALTRAGRGSAGSAGSTPRQAGLVRDALLVQAGLLASLMALISPLGYWSSAYLWVRAIQELTLCFIAPALIAAGRPWLVLGHLRHRPGLLRRASTPGPETAWRTMGPVLAVVAFNLVWLGWHVPAAFDLVQGNTAVRLAEHACYLSAGAWFWLQVAGPRGSGRWQAPLRRLALLTATAAAGSVLGMVLVFGANVVYPAYANPLHHVMTVLDDQQLSGAVLWMGMMPPLVIAGVALLNRWLDDEDSDISADLGRLLGRRTSGWSARSGMR
jgi:putative membrane protein